MMDEHAGAGKWWARGREATRSSHGQLRDSATSSTEEPGGPLDDVIERIRSTRTRAHTAGGAGRAGGTLGYVSPCRSAACRFMRRRGGGSGIQGAWTRRFRWVPAYGALRTVGLAARKKYRPSWPSPPRSTRASRLPGRSLPLRRRFDRQLDASGGSHSGTIRVAEVIPGAAYSGGGARP